MGTKANGSVNKAELSVFPSNVSYIGEMKIFPLYAVYLKEICRQTYVKYHVSIRRFLCSQFHKSLQNSVLVNNKREQLSRTHV